MALVKADGTALSKTPGGTVLESQPEADPKVKVLIDVYELTPYDHVDYPTQMTQLKFRAGQIISQKVWDAAFVAPTVASIAPATGPAAGGTSVTIKGTGFSVDATVKIGGTSATAVNVQNPTTLTCTAPAHEAGAVDVAVTTAGGTATKTGAFTYS